MDSRKLFGLGALGLLTAPVWLPLAWAYRVGYEGARVAFRYPKTTAACLLAGGILWYHGCRTDRFTAAIRGTVQAVQVRADQSAALQDLETLLSSVEQERSALRQQLAGRSAQEMIAEPGFNYYIVKPGETLSMIARGISGASHHYVRIAEDNGIEEPRSLLAGQLLRVRKELCTRYHPGVYERLPALQSVILPGEVRLSDHFGSRAPEVLQLNRTLGLHYGDMFPYRARVVYYR